MAHEQWRSQLDYLITLLGFAVGFGAFVKFPFYCMRNGGGAFLILYMFFTIIGTIPCVFLEMIIGQFSHSGICLLHSKVICCYSFYSYRPPKYGDYIYPTWSTAVGWLISFSSHLPLPTVCIWTVYNTQGATMKEKLKKSLQHNENWIRSPPEEENSEVLQPMVELATNSA